MAFESWKNFNSIVGKTQATVYKSNRLETLAAQLYLNFFSSDIPLFFEKWIVVPSRLVEEWLNFQFIKYSKQKISAGFRVLSLKQAVNELACFQFDLPAGKKPFPKDSTLFFTLFEKVSKDSFFEKQLNIHSKDIAAFCQELVYLFQNFSLYETLDQGSWERKLFLEVCHDYFTVKDLVESASFGQKNRPLTCALFGFSYFSSSQLAFFHRLCERIEISFYQLTPSYNYWGDQKTDREKIQFLGRKKLKEEVKTDYENFFEQDHCLLANLGKAARVATDLFDQWDFEEKDCFEEINQKSQLQKVQNSFLTLENLPVERNSQDDSIQFHTNSSLFREIESLKTTLNKCFLQAIEPSEILVLAPDISRYVPYIEAIFGQEIPFRINDAPLPFSSIAGGVMVLLSLAKERFKVSSVIRLFSHPLFAKKQNLSQEEIQKIRHWTQQLSIHWGVDPFSRISLLKERGAYLDENAKGTWRQGIAEALLLLAKDLETILSLPEIELAQDVLMLIYQLSSSLSEIAQKKEKKVYEWKIFLEDLIFNYFAVDDKDLLDQWLSDLEGSNYVTFDAVSFFLEKEMKKISMRKGKVGGIHFCSILPARILPSKVVCLLGMTDGRFPRKEPSKNLFKTQFLFCPKKQEIDRLLFLEAILSARQTLIISDLRINPETKDPTGPSIVVKELKNFLKDPLIFHHPDFSFDPAYFSQESHLPKSISTIDYECALQLQEKKKKKRSAPFEKIRKKELGTVLELKRLSFFLENPLKNYLHNLGIYLSKNLLVDEESFAFTAREISQISRKLGKNEMIDISHPGLFKQASLIRLEEAIEMSQKLKEFPQMTIELTRHVKHPVQDNEVKWRIPASFGKWHIEGIIEGFSGNLWIVPFENELKNIVKIYPILVLLNALEIPEILKPKKILFLKDGIEKEIVVFHDGDKKAEKLFSYYEKSFSSPSFLYPIFVEPLISKDLNKIEQLLEQIKLDDSFRYFSEELKWAMRRGALPSSSELLSLEGEIAIQFYKEVIDAWL